ncbi:ATP-dependent DNA ligase [Luteolibacter pohnpeiensis]|uniref:DNA ligase n=1 Tax=Luteolibacter pohnpeiensis TaxID=454153 RepID=A0A934S4Y9_9BACT|nr:ATP-dependent DNA ligase [Luteolibacter pohnpeiensis]MBK1883210.1 ATP-dependent DNA ligase [Luteolibacter pohnpeiensis]
MIDVQFNRGLYLPELDLWLDPWDAKPCAFVSHAHADHFARHESALCSEVTAALVQKRFHLGENRIESVPFQIPIIRDGFRIKLLPAGHIAGSAMLHVTRIKDNASLLYTGDFKARRGRTAEAVNFMAADTLITETTFGLPSYVFPNAMEIESSILRFVHDTFADGETPVLFGYSLGKAQEALALLTEHGIPALLHPNVAAMTAACREAGVSGLPEPIEFEGHPVEGHVIIAPPNTGRSKLMRSLKSKRTAMLTGWAMQPGAKFRYRVDEVIPLSDHADHPGLMECIQRVRPKRVLTVHGFAKEFAAELRGRNIDAWCAMGGDQLELSIAQSAQRLITQTVPRHNRAICSLADFSDLCRLVGETNSRVAKTEFLSNYLKNLETEQDLGLAAVWLTGEALPRHNGRRPLHAGSATIRRALLEIPAVREERYREISLSQNDSARTARLVLQEIPLRPEPLDLPGLEAFFIALSQSSGSIERINRLSERLTSLHPAEGETVVKLLTGDLRIGLKEGLVEDAIAEAFGADAAEVRHAHMLTGNIGETAILARQKRLHEASLRPLVPIKCMLASPLERGEEDDLPLFESLPFSAPIWLEPKYDGIRAQLHKQGDWVGLFSRDLRPLDSEFPDLLEAARSLDGDFVMDGELIAYAEGRKLGFADLQKRLGRQMAGSDLFLTDQGHDFSVPLRFIAFDLLWRNGDELLALPLRERRERLDQMQLSQPFSAIQVQAAASTGEIESLFKQSIQDGHEGLIAKDPESAYSPGRRGKSWIKLKGVMPTLDCVVVAAEQGHGKRSDVLSDYTFALRDEETGDLKILGKAYSGLTDDEIEDLTDHFRRFTLRKERRKHFVEPNLVLEIAFDAIRSSARHDSGLALRFPRIKAIRRDKAPAEIDTLQTARSLV